MKEVCSSLNVETEVQIKELSPPGTDTPAREEALRSVVKADELKAEVVQSSASFSEISEPGPINFVTIVTMN